MHVPRALINEDNSLSRANTKKRRAYTFHCTLINRRSSRALIGKRADKVSPFIVEPSILSTRLIISIINSARLAPRHL